MLLVAFYELTGPLLYELFGLGDEVVSAQDIFGAFASTTSVNSFLLALLAFLAVVHASYFFSRSYFFGANIAPIPAASLDHEPVEDARVFYALIFLIFVSGLVSVYAGAGTIRLQDYLGEGQPTTPLFSYGGVLLTPLFAFGVYCVRRRRWKLLATIALAALPLVYELFLTSRRQHFAPLVCALLLYVLYSRGVQRKALVASGIIAAGLFVLGLQYWMRATVTDGVGSSETLGTTLAPQFGEFVAIGSTSFYAWDSIVLGPDSATYGFHWYYEALNTVPYYKLGDVLYPEYAGQIYEMYRALAPYGGLSMLADSILGFGAYGVIILAVLIGLLLRRGHQFLVNYAKRGFPFTPAGAYGLSLIAVLLMKYRSGVADSFRSFVTFSLLYIFAVLVGRLSLLWQAGDARSLDPKLRSAT